MLRRSRRVLPVGRVACVALLLLGLAPAAVIFAAGCSTDAATSGAGLDIRGDAASPGAGQDAALRPDPDAHTDGGVDVIDGAPDADVRADAGDAAEGDADPLLVRTTLGPVAGALDQGVPSFRGIPYAAPPLGPLRFRAPQAATAWTTARDATTFASTCIQLATDGTLIPGGSEDCLTLNVWTPTTTPAATGPLPVLVFLHGGYFVKGGATYLWHEEKVYDGAQLAALASAVVVTVQYRLGALGFLAHPALSLPEAPHGNYGLLDQIAALGFVKSNIAAFGGDPAAVTIFGQSAGGDSVAALLASPLAAGLFARAIIESGGFAADPVATAVSNADGAADALGCSASPDVAACLRGADAAAVAVSLPDSALGPHRWHPVADGYLLGNSPLALFQIGAWNKVPVVLGTNRDELSAMVYDYLRARSLPTPTTRKTYDSDVAAFYPGASETAAVLQMYPYSAYASDPVSGLAQLLADDQYTCPARAAARALSSAGTPVYRYLFVHSLLPGDFPDGGDPTYGAYHFLEVPFVFHALTPFDFTFDVSEYGLSTQMISMWANFAVSGNPSTRSQPWPLYVPASDPYLAIDVTSTPSAGVRPTFCDFWDSH